MGIKYTVAINKTPDNQIQQVEKSTSEKLLFVAKLSKTVGHNKLLLLSNALTDWHIK